MRDRRRRAPAPASLRESIYAPIRTVEPTSVAVNSFLAKPSWQPDAAVARRAAGIETGVERDPHIRRCAA